MYCFNVFYEDDEKPRYAVKVLFFSTVHFLIRRITLYFFWLYFVLCFSTGVLYFNTWQNTSLSD